MKMEKNKNMRNVTTSAILCCLITSSAVAQDRPATLAQRQEEFIELIKAIADGGDLEDTQKMENLLHTKLTLRHDSEKSAQPSTCADPGEIKSSEYAVFNPPQKFWYAPTPDGRKDIIVGGGFSGGTPHKIEPPQFGYSIFKSTYCTGRHAAEPDISVNMGFDNLPQYLCLTPDILKSLLPEAKPLQATDGAVLYRYDGKKTKEEGVQVTFAGMYGIDCILGVQIDQNERYGNHANP